MKNALQEVKIDILFIVINVLDIVNMRLECIKSLIEYIRATFDLEFLFTQVMNAPLTESEQNQLNADTEVVNLSSIYTHFNN